MKRGENYREAECCHHCAYMYLIGDDDGPPSDLQPVCRLDAPTEEEADRGEGWVYHHSVCDKFERLG